MTYFGTISKTFQTRSGFLSKRRCHPLVWAVLHPILLHLIFTYVFFPFLISFIYFFYLFLFSFSKNLKSWRNIAKSYLKVERIKKTISDNSRLISGGLEFYDILQSFFFLLLNYRTLSFELCLKKCFSSSNITENG